MSSNTVWRELQDDDKKAILERIVAGKELKTIRVSIAEYLAQKTPDIRETIMKDINNLIFDVKHFNMFSNKGEIKSIELLLAT